MKRLKVNAYQVALVLKNGEYRRMLTAGNYWLWGEQVLMFDITRPFYAPVDLNILLKDEALADILHVIEVKDNEIVLVYKNGLLEEVLTTGRYTYWKTLIPYQFVKADVSKIEITEDIDRATLTHKLVSPYVRSIAVESYEKALLFVDGKYVRLIDSGTYYWWKNSIAIHVARLDTRLMQFEINGQEILTKDKAGLRINAMAQYRIEDPEKAVLYNKEYDKQLYMIFQLALREYIGTFSLDEILEKKETIAPFVLQSVNERVAELGVKVIGFGIRDIILPGDVKDILSQVLVAEKKAQANIIMRREETASTRSLLNTAKLMEDNAMLWKLKEMEYVEKIADKINSISVNGSGMLIDQLKQIFTPSAKAE